MKKGVGFVLAVSLLLAGCASGAAQSQMTAPPEAEHCLRVITPDLSLWDPFLKEFQYRTGIWVNAEQMDASDASGLLEENPDSANLLLGYEPETLREILPAAEIRNVIYQVPVLVYNSHLIRRNLPEGFADLTDAHWQGDFAVADPCCSGFGRSVVQILVQQNSSLTAEEVLKRFSRNLAGVAETGRKVVQLVRNGTCAMGIVAESEIRAAEEQGISVVYPAEGSYLLPAAMASPAPDEGVRQLMEFLLEESTQHHAWEFCGLRPAQLELLPHNPRRPEPDDMAWENLTGFWSKIREDLP